MTTERKTNQPKYNSNKSSRAGSKPRRQAKAKPKTKVRVIVPKKPAANRRIVRADRVRISAHSYAAWYAHHGSRHDPLPPPLYEQYGHAYIPVSGDIDYNLTINPGEELFIFPTPYSNTPVEIYQVPSGDLANFVAWFTALNPTGSQPALTKFALDATPTESWQLPLPLTFQGGDVRTTGQAVPSNYGAQLLGGRLHVTVLSPAQGIGMVRVIGGGDDPINYGTFHESVTTPANTAFTGQHNLHNYGNLSTFRDRLKTRPVVGGGVSSTVHSRLQLHEDQPGFKLMGIGSAYTDTSMTNSSMWAAGTFPSGNPLSAYSQGLGLINVQNSSTVDVLVVSITGFMAYALTADPTIRSLGSALLTSPFSYPRIDSRAQFPRTNYNKTNPWEVVPRNDPKQALNPDPSYMNLVTDQENRSRGKGSDTEPFWKRAIMGGLGAITSVGNAFTAYKGGSGNVRPGSVVEMPTRAITQSSSSGPLRASGPMIEEVMEDGEAMMGEMAEEVVLSA